MATCRECGCDDDHACEGGCYWVEPDLCSRCVDPKPVELGPCCICETTKGVRSIVMLSRRAPIAGHGWGCVVCHLPQDGAYAVLCDSCCASYHEAVETLKFACRGYPSSEGRVPFDELPPGHFDHDMSVDHG